MTFAEWVRNSKERVLTEPIHTAVSVSAETFVEGIHRRLGTASRGRVRGGTNIYDLEWDHAIVLDACSVPIFRQVAREYPWLDVREPYRSVGGYSLHWLQETFTSEYADAIADTAFTAWNPYTDHASAIEPSRFAALEEVHRDGWDDALGCVPPAAVTDAALEYVDTGERRIVWYQQPHAPYRTLLSEVETLSEEVIGNEDNGRLTVWNLLRRGEVTREEAVIACAENLRWVLDDVERYLAAVPRDERVIVTADHGELFGDGGRYGHPKTSYRDAQLRVPLAKVELARVGDEPEYAADGAATDTAAERLQALGYVD
ncbi:hypothetical protein EGH24_13740 [Halonotius terrestris]|uniref:Sulfatase n=1 Tax=Halonotius terrestris TaxID=2487750 RepID=A0A8J8TBA1_9EURY|nr:hypothetical protein [Halonotius terrestris]TQQ78579.1 hypothetical protein EGH24_13740 [Halonotius terrestris]